MYYHFYKVSYLGFGWPLLLITEGKVGGKIGLHGVDILPDLFLVAQAITKSHTLLPIVIVTRFFFLRVTVRNRKGTKGICFVNAQKHRDDYRQERLIVFASPQSVDSLRTLI